jgi:hypothetical protein
MTNFFKPRIRLNQVMLFGPNNSILIKFMKMFVTLEHFSDYLNGGSYEFFSRVRVGYLFIKKARAAQGAIRGGGGELEDGMGSDENMRSDENIEEVDEYMEGLESMYGLDGGSSRLHNARKTRNTRNARKKYNKQNSKKYTRKHK